MKRIKYFKQRSMGQGCGKKIALIIYDIMYFEIQPLKETDRNIRNHP